MTKNSQIMNFFSNYLIELHLLADRNLNYLNLFLIFEFQH